MKLTSSYIFLNEVRFHAYHGVLPQENVSSAMQHDMLEVALNYATLYQLIEREMSKPSQLIEHVAGRIAECVFREFPMVASLDLTITKLNPPMGADCKGAGVELHLINDKTGK